MNPVQLLSHFDRISDAPDAIPHLRRFILDLAVRGKLIEQDPRDEPASELLKRIQAEKERLVKTGEIRKGNPFPRVEDDEAPFASPAGWEWVRIRQVTSDRGQATPDNDFTYIDVTAINKEVGRVANAKVLSASDAPSRARKLVRTGDVLYSCVRPYLLNIAVIESDIVPSPIASTAFAVLNGFGLVLSTYLWIVLRSPFMVECVEGKMRGQAYPAINDSDFALLPLPLPPLDEQQHIVSKVEELMALCDRLEAAQAERESRRDRLAAASLHRLNNGADADAFREHARFYFNRLRRLTTRPEHIQELRQTILNLAIRGKLVPQDPNDEPASELLIRIQSEKARLLKEGKISSEKPPIPARADELAFELKPGWQAARISQILVELQTGPFGSSLHQSDYQKGGIPVINPASIKNERLVPVESMAIGPTTLKRLFTFKLRAGDIVMARRGEMGRCAAVTKKESGWLCGTGSLILRLPKFVFPQFFVTLIGSPFVREYLGSSAVGATMQNLNQSILLNLVIGLPPFAEQHRIVAKVEELMALCDQLEAQITTTQTESRRLIEAILHVALSPLLTNDISRATHSSPKMVGAHTLAASMGRPNKHFARALLSAEIVHQLHAEPTFGRTKHQKILHLCEHIARIEEMSGEYPREAAGPLDNRMIYSVAAELKKQRWYEEYRRPQFGHGYKPLGKAGGHRKYLERYWPDKLSVIRRLVDIMRTWDTDRCEIFATAYAAWNDLLIWKREPSDEAILEEVLGRWHERKKRFSEERWRATIDWIRKEGFIPVGFGKPTKQLANT